MQIFTYFLTAFAVIFSVVLSATTDSSSTFTNLGADIEKRKAILDAFNYNYENYMKYAYPQDCIDLKESKGAVDGATVGFGGTPIEALSTMILMNLTDTDNFKAAVKVIENQTFYTTNESYIDGVQGTVKLYELTVRLIGGMLSAYQMNGEKPEEAFFINKTKTLADRIKGSWVGNQTVPVSIWNMKNQTPYDLDAETNFAEAGTITLEWSTLSHYTNDLQYKNLVEGSVNTLRKLPQVFPGLSYAKFHPKNLTSNAKYVTLGARMDGYIAYLLKYPLMLGKPDHPYIETWKEAAQSIKDHLSFKSGINNFTFGGDYDADRNTSIRLFSHWACFLGANLAMGGRLFERDDFTILGLEFTESCAATYDETILGLGPYAFGYADQNGNFTGWKFVSKQQREFYNKHGIFITIAYWFTEYDIVEGLFYAWRITGMQLWRDLAWKIFMRIKEVADTGHGFAIVNNVNDPSTDITGPQPPFVYSALLKYLYLIFDDHEHYSLDEIVFSKEAMPFKRVKNDKFGKIQGTFKYTPIFYGQNHSSTSISLQENAISKALGKASLDEGSRPPGLFDAKSGSGKIQFAKQLSSYTGMPESLAMDYVAAFNK